ncbi:protocadherin gamma-A4-like [Protopterus annectens]|uniref:protocadherin gamma-A4-like n=1 Tax=Protopterus annectens TaxID=7888 RepID=UPI001CFA7E40|nr:protocadherin gamma-A4-like [Protopterus annectens]
MGKVSKPRWKCARHQLFFFLFYSFQSLTSGVIRYSVPEEMDRGYFIGHLANDVGIPRTDVAARRLRISSSSKNRFLNINSETGDLFLTERVDREELCGKMPSCILAFEAVVENPFQVFAGEIEIQDINDNPPVFLSNEIKLSISEFTPLGSRFPLEQAEDPDVGVNSLLDYDLNINEYFSLIVTDTESGHFIELVLNNSLDYEKQSDHFLTITVKDNGIPRRSGTSQIHISVVDVNDNKPAFSQAVYKTSIKEGSPKGTLLVKVNATDRDGAAYGQVRYAFKKISETTRSMFKLDPVSGEIRLEGILDYEETKWFEITVEAKDGGGFTAHSKVLIDILDDNDNAPQITFSSVSDEILEDAVPGTVIAFINIDDLDSNDNSDTSCHIQENIPFKLKLLYKNYYTLELNGSLDREKTPEYNITITAVDKGSPPLSSVKTIFLKISDINDNPPQFSKAIYTAYIKENNPPGHVILTVEAKDTDWKQNAQVTYSIVPGYVGESLVSTFVSINPDNGNIYALRSFDYETFRDFYIVVKAEDYGSPPLSTNATVNVFVLDENDNVPKILYPAPSDEASVGIEIVPLMAEANYLVTKVVAVDADSGQNAWLSYHLLKATDPSLFKVGYHTGEIRTSRPVLMKEPMKQTLSVIVKDNGQPSHSSTATVTIIVADSDSFPQPLLDALNPSENKPRDSNLTLYLLISVVCVSVLFLCFIIIIFIIRFHRWRQSSLLKPTFIDYSHEHPSDFGEREPMGHIQPPYIQRVCLTSNSGRSELQFMKPYGLDTVGSKAVVTDADRTELYSDDSFYAETNAVSQVRSFIK